MDTYLSIDLDFWSSEFYHTDSSIRKFFKRLPKVSTVLVREHHELLPHINKTRLSRLINVDYHSDLAGFRNKRRKLPELNEGTWVDHVRWRNGSEFVWHCPNFKTCYVDGWGRCDSQCGDSVLETPKQHGWGSATIRGSLRGIDMRRVARVGISLSLDWLDGPHSRAVLPYLRRLDAELADDLEEFIEEKDFAAL